MQQNISDEIQIWEGRFGEVLGRYEPTDPSHDSCHFKRVWKLAKEIAAYEEQVDYLVLLAASCFHDFGSLPKGHPEAAQASRISAQKSVEKLREMNFPEEHLDSIKHAIEAHSFSGKIEPETIEAKIVQDADRIESMGAVGLARVFTVGGTLGAHPFHPMDPLAKSRELDDKKYTLDHFMKKLFLLENGLKTKGGKIIGKDRSDYLRRFVDQLVKEIAL